MENKSYKKFRYVVINSQGKRVKGYLDVLREEEARAYLLSQEYEILTLKETSKFWTMNIGSNKLKYSELAFVLTQLSTYLKVSIPLIEAVKILEKQATKEEQKRVFANISYHLAKGESFSEALKSQKKVFPKLLINMIKASEQTGDLPKTLDDMALYYTDLDKTKKQTITAMTYPIIIFIFALMVITFILLYIIPEFVGLFEKNHAALPGITKFIINISNFLTNNIFIIVIVILLVILIYSYLYSKVKTFRKAMQTIFLKLPIVSKIIMYKEVAMFTKTFSSLLAHNVFITDSMDILSNITSNEVYKDIINDSLKYLEKGEKISESFKGKWAFPIVAYEMLQTGENTGRLATMMDYVGNYYNELHTNLLKRLNTFIEPVMILLLSLIVGVVVLSIVIPMFSFYTHL